MTHRPFLMLLGLTCGLAACTDWPEIEIPGAAESAAAPWPQLAPIETMTGEAAPTQYGVGPSEARIAALEARAAALRDAVVDDNSRSDMEHGVDMTGLVEDALN